MGSSSHKLSTTAVAATAGSINGRGTTVLAVQVDDTQKVQQQQQQQHAVYCSVAAQRACSSRSNISYATVSSRPSMQDRLLASGAQHFIVAAGLDARHLCMKAFATVRWLTCVCSWLSACGCTGSFSMVHRF
jgi:hypothetical protein